MFPNNNITFLRFDETFYQSDRVLRHRVYLNRERKAHTNARYVRGSGVLHSISLLVVVRI